MKQIILKLDYQFIFKAIYNVGIYVFLQVRFYIYIYIYIIVLNSKIYCGSNDNHNFKVVTSINILR